jgi:hypothetical protein
MEGNPLKKLQELAQKAKDKGFNPESKTVETKKEIVSYDEAADIMKESFYGFKEILDTFDIYISKEEMSLYPIPFSKAELERAKQLGQELILYVDKDSDDNSLTGKHIKKLYGDNKTVEGLTSLSSDWFFSDSVASKEVPRLGWRLSAKDPFKESTSKNYFEQTAAIVAHLEKDIFPEGLPLIYREAVEEFEAVKGSLCAPSESSDDDEWKPAAEQLSNLKINQMCRENFTEVLYRLALREKKIGVQLFDSPYSGINYTWTSSRDSDGHLVYVGLLGSYRAGVDRWRSRYAASYMGVCFSRGV